MRTDPWQDDIGKIGNRDPIRGPRVSIMSRIDPMVAIVRMPYRR